MRRLRRNRFQQTAEMNITAFMNLMVILVPFLLLTTVFSHLVIIELNLPTAKKPANQIPKNIPLRLELVIRSDRIDVTGMNRKPVSYPKKQGQYNLSGLQTLLKNIKAEFPDHTSVSLLAEDGIAYEDLISVMDTVRTLPMRSEGSWVQVELFPNVSIGDAPRLNPASDNLESRP